MGWVDSFLVIGALPQFLVIGALPQFLLIGALPPFLLIGTLPPFLGKSLSFGYGTKTQIGLSIFKTQNFSILF
jgi:hypothetical protein